MEAWSIHPVYIQIPILWWSWWCDIRVVYLRIVTIYFNSFCPTSGSIRFCLRCVRFYNCSYNRNRNQNEKTRDKKLYFCNHSSSSVLTTDSHLTKNRFIYIDESPLKMLENVFYFILKVNFFQDFFLDFLVKQEKRLDWKDRVNFKTVTSQPGKVNQTMKFDEKFNCLIVF